MTIRSGKRALAVLSTVVAGAVFGNMLAGPAAAHKEKGESHKHVLTKKSAKKLYLRKAGKAADADALDGIDSSAFAPRIGNVVTVAATGGDFTTVQAALSSITDASAQNRYLVLVGPGTFPGRVTMKSFVDIAGMGVGTTMITAPGDPACASGSTVRAAAGATISDLTIRNTGGSGCGVGLLVEQPVGSPFRDLEIDVSGAVATNVGIEASGTLTLADVSVKAAAGGASGPDLYGVRATGGIVTIKEGVVHTSGGMSGSETALRLVNADAYVARSEMRTSGSPLTLDRVIVATSSSIRSLRVDQSQVSGDDDGINANGNYQVDVGASFLAGGIGGAADFDCAQSYRGGYWELNTACA